MHLIPQRGHEVLEAAPHQVAITGQVARHLGLRQAGQASHVTLAQPLPSDGIGDESPRTHPLIMPHHATSCHEASVVSRCPGVPDTVTGGRATRSTSPPLRRRAWGEVGRSGSAPGPRPRPAPQLLTRQAPFTTSHGTMGRGQTRQQRRPAIMPQQPTRYRVAGGQRGPGRPHHLSRRS